MPGWLSRKINTSPSTIDDKDILKKFLTTPPVKKIDLHFPLGMEVTARSMKGVTIKDAMDAIHKAYKKRVRHPTRHTPSRKILGSFKFSLTHIPFSLLDRPTTSWNYRTWQDSNGTRKSLGLGWSSTCRRKPVYPQAAGRRRRRAATKRPSIRHSALDSFSSCSLSYRYRFGKKGILR